MGVSASAVSRVTGIEVTPKNFNKECKYASSEACDCWSGKR